MFPVMRYPELIGEILFKSGRLARMQINPLVSWASLWADIVHS